MERFIVRCRLVESQKRAGRWKVWVKEIDGQGWFAGEKAYASRLNAEKAVARRYNSEGIIYEWVDKTLSDECVSNFSKIIKSLASKGV